MRLLWLSHTCAHFSVELSIELPMLETCWSSSAHDNALIISMSVVAGMTEWFLINSQKKKKIQGWNVRSGWKMLRLWTCGFQGAGRASRWRFLAVSWKYMTDCCSWLQKWKLKSFSEKFKLWFDRNHTVSKRENTQDHSPVEDRPQGGREKESRRSSHGFWRTLLWPVKGQAEPGMVFVVDPLLAVLHNMTSFSFSAWRNLFPLSLFYALFCFSSLEPPVGEGSVEDNSLGVEFSLCRIRKADSKEEVSRKSLEALAALFWFVH